MDLFRCDAEDGRYGWAADVDVHDSGLHTIVRRERPAELSGEGGFADAAFPGEDDDLALYGANAIADEGECGIGDVWSVGGTGLLVRTAVAGIYLSCEV